MRARTFTLLAVIALVAAACGPEQTAESTTTAPVLEETTTTAPPAEAVLLSYSLEAGSSYTYEVDLDQSIDLTATGDPTALGEEEIPGEMAIQIAGTSVFTHSVAAGPEPETYAVTITGDFSDIELSGTVDGEPVSSDDIPEFAAMEPVDVTIVVDAQGNLIPDESGLGEDLLGDLGGLGALDQLGSGAGIGQFVGPPFTEEEVAVGDTWSETIEVPTLPGDAPVTTQIDSVVTGTDTVDGSEVFVIETTTTTSAIEFDLAEVLIGLMTGFLPEEATDEERAEMEALAAQLRFVFSIDESTADLTTLFDHEAGLARQAEFSSTTHMVMDVNIPDETTGELVEFGMDMNLSQSVVYRLTSADST